MKAIHHRAKLGKDNIFLSHKGDVGPEGNLPSWILMVT